MTSISKNMYIDKLDDIVNEYINTYHNTTKMKPVDFNKKNNKEDHKFKAGYHVRILKYKNIFVKGYVPNWSEEVFVITKVKNTVPWTYVIRVLGQLSPRKICPPPTLILMLTLNQTLTLTRGNFSREKLSGHRC